MDSMDSDQNHDTDQTLSLFLAERTLANAFSTFSLGCLSTGTTLAGGLGSMIREMVGDTTSEYINAEETRSGDFFAMIT